ncbi:MAG: orotidine-5'-phosphate decarboxylase [Chloroflexota bacterium]
MVTPFHDRLRSVWRTAGSLLCVGLDVDPRLVPPGVTERPDWISQFVLDIVEATRDLVCAYKPNIAFYEALGLDGYQGLRKILDGLPRDVVVIGDVKRGDIGNTASAYATAMFDGWGFDAITVSPLMGRDSLDPFLARPDRGAFVLCKTSNPGSADFLDRNVDGEPLYELIARRCVEWDERSNVGLVVGATFPPQLERVRALAPNLPILVPGVGSQQGDLAAAVRAGVDAAGEGILVSASRSVMFASRGSDWRDAARRSAMALRDEIDAARARSAV